MKEVIMYRELVAELAVLSAIISMGSLYISDLQVWRKRHWESGVIAGVVGSIMMWISTPTAYSIILDIRNLSIAIVSVYAGALSGMLAVAILSLCTVLFLGVSGHTIMAMGASLLIAFIGGLVSRMQGPIWKKLAYAYIAQVLVTCTSIVIFLQDAELSAGTLLGYGLVSFGGGIIILFIFRRALYFNEEFLRLHRFVYKDYLTGLNNVRSFDAAWERHIRMAEENNYCLSLLMIDIDHFKKVNDTYGHLIGNEVLKQLAAVVDSACLGIDTVSRNGGEEFSVIMPNCPHHRAVERAEQIRVAVEGHKFMIDQESDPLGITVSVGVATYPDPSQELDQLTWEADRCLYAAKRQGRNRVSGAGRKID